MLFIMVECRTCYVFTHIVTIFMCFASLEIFLIVSYDTHAWRSYTSTHVQKTKKEAETLFRVVLKYILLWQYVYMVVAAKIFLYATMFCLPVFVICSGISALYLSISLSTMMYYDHNEGNVSPFYSR